jgi:dimethylamine monooxygenase subunit A
MSVSTNEISRDTEDALADGTGIGSGVDPHRLSARIKGFPFPFREDSYRYSTNVEPALHRVQTEAGSWGERIIDIDDGYLDEQSQREDVLKRDPTRMQLADHMQPAVWDTITTLLPLMASTYPESMQFQREGRACTWRNDLQGLEIQFVVGEDESLPMGPLRFIASQIQDDIVLLDQREGALWLDAGLVTFAADWSMGFDVGMRFLEVHGPVPRVHEEKIMTRAHQFLLRLEPGEQYRRTNWTMTVDRRLDTSTETYPDWAQDRTLVVSDPALPDRLHLRVEVQHLIKLPHSGALLFLVRTYLASLREIAAVPAWRERLGKVIEELPADMAEYKGIERYQNAAAAWLKGGER